MILNLTYYTKDAYKKCFPTNTFEQWNYQFGTNENFFENCILTLCGNDELIDEYDVDIIRVCVIHENYFSWLKENGFDDDAANRLLYMDEMDNDTAKMYWDHLGLGNQTLKMYVPFVKISVSNVIDTKQVDITDDGLDKYLYENIKLALCDSDNFIIKDLRISPTAVSVDKITENKRSLTSHKIATGTGDSSNYNLRTIIRYVPIEVDYYQSNIFKLEEDWVEDMLCDLEFDEFGEEKQVYIPMPPIYADEVGYNHDELSKGMKSNISKMIRNRGNLYL